MVSTKIMKSLDMGIILKVLSQNMKVTFLKIRKKAWVFNYFKMVTIIMDNGCLISIRGLEDSTLLQPILFMRVILRKVLCMGRDH